MSDWKEDIDLDIKDNLYVGEALINEQDEFKFRANYSWDYSLGSSQLINNGEPVSMVSDGEKMKVAVGGYYRIELIL